MGIEATQAQFRAVARTQKKSESHPEKSENDHLKVASKKRVNNTKIRNTYKDEDIRHWFADDPTSDRRSQVRRALCNLIAMGVIETGDPMPTYRRLSEITGLYKSLFQHMYEEMREQGIIRSEGRVAFFAADPLQARLALAEEIIAHAIYQCKYRGLDEARIQGVFEKEIARAKSGKIPRRKT